MMHFDIRQVARPWLFALVTLGLAGCGSNNDDNDISTSNTVQNTPQSTQAAIQELTNAFAATLTAAQAVPPRPSSATGSGTVVVNANTRLMTATLTTIDIAGSAAHIQQAPTGVSGPIVFPLNETSAGSGIWTTTATLTEAQFNALRAGELYFNVRSNTFPDGEIRGQIVAQLTGGTGAASGSGTGTGSTTGTGATGTGATVPPTGTTGTGSTSTGAGLIQGVTSTATFLAALRGQHAVPVALTAAQGSGTVLVNPASRQTTAAIVAIGMNGTEGHIHEGALGTIGPIAVSLVQTGPGSGIWTTKATLTEAQYRLLQDGNMYFEVHSAAFPSGEIRGQILPQKLQLPLVTGALGNNATPSAATTGTGTPATTSNPLGIPVGTGVTGTGAGGAGGIGTTGTGTGAGIGTGVGIGTGIGTGGIGTVGIGTSGTGNTGVGVVDTGIGTGGIGTTGIGSVGSGITGTGTTGTGTTGTGTSGIGTMGIGTSGTGITGSGLIGTTPSGSLGSGLTGTGTLTTTPSLPLTSSTGIGSAGLAF